MNSKSPSRDHDIASRRYFPLLIAVDIIIEHSRVFQCSQHPLNLFIAVVACVTGMARCRSVLLYSTISYCFTEILVQFKPSDWPLPVENSSNWEDISPPSPPPPSPVRSE